MKETSKLHIGLLGSIIGDIVGSAYEWDRIKTKDFPLFTQGCNNTDDTVMTIATANAILRQSDYGDEYHKWGRKYPHMGYGSHFRGWLQTANAEPYGSYGNGSAMRVGPVGYAFEDEDTVFSEARISAICSHNHPEGIKGAEATAMAIFQARNGATKGEIRSAIEKAFGYDLSRTVKGIRPRYEFFESCQRTVPEAIISFLDSTDYEDTVRNAVSLGGDADTLACIAGGIAAAFYGGMPEKIVEEAASYLTNDMLKVLEEFQKRFPFSLPKAEKGGRREGA